MPNTTCSIEGCENNSHARGWCPRHYGIWRHKGDVNAQASRHYSSPAESLEARTERRGDCLLWMGYRTNHGYGMVSDAGSLVMAHRLAWELQNGPIPIGVEIDHTCWNRNCCNVEHLRESTRHENMRNRNGAQSTSTTGVRNVRIEGGRFRVIVNGQYIATYDDLDEARQSAERERNAQFGEFAGRG